MILLIAILFSVASNLLADDVFRYTVYREKLTRDEKGELVIDQTAISYKSEDAKKSIQISLGDVYEADVSHPRKIRIETYDIVKRKLIGRQSYMFKLREGEHGSDLTRFLTAHLKRPVVGFLASSPAGEAYELPAYHRHRFGGCHGKLRVDAGGIQFVSDRAQDSRTWAYAHIETVGTMNEFHFRVSSLNETYNFDLKEQLPAAAYDLSFKSVTGLKPVVEKVILQ
jgi:hypothetical protein